MESKSMKKEAETRYGKNQEVLKDMLDSIGKSAAVFKSQQIDDPEISQDDKRKLAEALLFESPVSFLARFGTFLTERHLQFFATFKNESNGYDIDFHIAQLRSLLTAEAKRRLTRNRRFEALKRLQSQGKYFSESEMERREPLLYHQLVGQYLSEKEKVERFKEVNKDAIPSFSSFLIQQAEKDALNDLRKQQEAAEAAEAASSDEETPPPSVIRDEPMAIKWGADWEDEEMEKKRKQHRAPSKASKSKITPDERELLLEEFRTCLYTKFLDGLDADFDYSLVDLNPDYDCLQVRSQDEEEKYFDEETCDETLCTDTGVEDY